jgi:hypothetical protein
MTNAELQKIIDRRNQLFVRIDALSTMDTNPTIQDIKLEYAEEMTRLDKLITEKREYLYNFKSGGWNSEWAVTSNQAYAQAMERWGDDPKLQIDPQSFRASTPADYQNLLSLFH